MNMKPERIQAEVEASQRRIKHFVEDELAALKRATDVQPTGISIETFVRSVPDSNGYLLVDKMVVGSVTIKTANEVPA